VSIAKPGYILELGVKLGLIVNRAKHMICRGDYIRNAGMQERRRITKKAWKWTGLLGSNPSAGLSECKNALNRS
jgi:hypothetical protein